MVPAFHHWSDRRLLFMTFVVVLGMVVLGLQLWRVQIVDGPKYAECVAQNSEVRVRIPPVRGEIRDRNGVPLATNRAQLDIEFYLPEMVRAFQKRHEAEVPMVRYPGRVHGMLKMLTEPDIVSIVNSAVVPRLQELGLRAGFDQARLARHFRINSEVPFTFIEGADFATIAKFSEHDLGLPGVRIEVTPVREYPYGAFGAHLLGYVGDPPEFSALPDVREFDFYEPNVEGKAQVEFLMDRFLRGTPGVRVMHRNPKGVIDKEKSIEPPITGATVDLTIDARIQFIAEEALRSVARAGAVVVDPNSGEILAMASVPSFDPNIFVPAIDAAVWENLTKDETNPLVNRAISAFPPGSTFKIITSLAGLRQGLATKPFTCSGGVSYGDHYFQCWKSSGHGTLTVGEAIKVSCNAFFYQYGNAAGIDSIDVIGTLLGLGQPPGTGLSGEQAGVLPGPQWLRLHAPAERWSSAYTANVSIGQGYDLVSPLQLVLAYSAVANGGVSYYPRLIKRIADGNSLPPGDGDCLRLVAQEPQRRGDLRDAHVSPAELELVRQGFWRVVNEDGGTARRARLAGGIVAGKTGTAQAQRHGHEDTIAWFVCFAPYEKPRYAVCVMVQGGAHGGSVAAPIAAKILDETLAMDRGDYHPALVALTPARQRDPFRMLESIDVASSVPPPVVSQENEPARPPAADASQHTHRADFAPPRLKKAQVAVGHPAPPRLKRANAERAAPRAPADVQRAPAEPPAARKNFIQWLLGPRRSR